MTNRMPDPGELPCQCLDRGLVDKRPPRTCCMGNGGAKPAATVERERGRPDVVTPRDPGYVVPLDEAIEALRVEVNAGMDSVSLTDGEARALLERVDGLRQYLDRLVREASEALEYRGEADSSPSWYLLGRRDTADDVRRWLAGKSST